MKPSRAKWSVTDFFTGPTGAVESATACVVSASRPEARDSHELDRTLAGAAPL